MSTETATQWCLVGNIIETRQYGQDGLEQRQGTKHFSPGTKVYCLPSQWGDGYEKILVIGRHRGSKRFVKMIVRSSWVVDWRAQTVYHPSVLALLRSAGHCNWNSESEVKQYLQSMLEVRGAHTTG